ncbi:MAG: hypothetical protein A2289_16130 [Deltaproteobacteria bacterium RIFOXYA12_FULL_58_15]|nr:MAG: hypothetical protein A2289_16130 [Deltaproteobacteria bacterium RIFOXYA12_FULL_58_15]OGR15225.1 MAG: hypothetical protein A2341_09020 [Deltaproteobacteria bacterium RIFOXYB12_FULL_58_9]
MLVDLYATPNAAVPFLILLAVGAWTDLRSRRVPNLLSATVAVGGLAWSVAAHQWQVALIGLVCGVGVIVLLWVPWSRGGIGGGDVKLAAAAAVWIGYQQLLAYLLSGAAIGGLVALGAYFASKQDARAEIRNNMFLAVILKAWPSAPQARGGRVSVPYALAILGGGAYVIAAPSLGWPT